MVRHPNLGDISISQLEKIDDVDNLYRYQPRQIEKNNPGAELFTSGDIAVGGVRANQSHVFPFRGNVYDPGLSKGNCWKHTAHPDMGSSSGMARIGRADRLYVGQKQIRYVRKFSDFGVQAVSNWWDGFGGASDRVYVVQTSNRIVERCILLVSDPGDLVLDPTCGSGTTAYVAEQWGRRWITVDTSRVSLALARARVMGARYQFYLLTDSPKGQKKIAELDRAAPSTARTQGDIRQGFVYHRKLYITSSVIANNGEIDSIWEQKQPAVEQALANLNAALKGHKTPFKVEAGGRAGKKVDFTAADGKTVDLPSGETTLANALLEWEVPREKPNDWPAAADAPLSAFWEARIDRQREIDASIAAKAEHEYLYDKPYVDNAKVRVAGPFTVESISPHRAIAVDQNDELIDEIEAAEGNSERSEADYDTADFAEMVLENLKVAGVQQAHKADRITFSSVAGWPGNFICAEGKYQEGDDENAAERRAGIFIGPEFGTVSRADLVAAAREAADAGFDVLIACAFNFEAHTTEFDKLGRVPVLKARMNADLHMGGDLKTTKSGNLFVVFGEPDIDIAEAAVDDDGHPQITVTINGVDVFRPQSGEITSSDPDEIACWFIDTDYNEESFFVRHAYFLGAQDPYKSLKTTLKAEIDRDAWETLHSAISRPFPKPKSGRIAVKVINHLGDEVMKVFGIK
ncbi:MAG: DNA methyltransferase [Rhodospirillales bacterium]